MTQEEMVEQFQCPGCMGGGDVKCGRYMLSETVHADGGVSFRCGAQVLEMSVVPLGATIALGLPRGFCRSSFCEVDVDIRFWQRGQRPLWDVFNVPVWALEQDGFLFVRTYIPRLNHGMTDVVEGGRKAELCPQALDAPKDID